MIGTHGFFEFLATGVICFGDSMNYWKKPVLALELGSAVPMQ
jgi:hypothetical protein